MGDQFHSCRSEVIVRHQSDMTGPQDLPQVDKTALSEKDDVTSRRHGETVDLRLHVDSLLRVLLEPSDINLNVEVSDAANMSIGSPFRNSRERLTCKQ